jgi:quinol monooxygenase YgiN
MQEHMRAEEPETLQYELHGIPGDETVRVLVETYCSRAAFAFHERQPYTRVFLQERARYLQGEPEVIELTPLSPLHRVP